MADKVDLSIFFLPLQKNMTRCFRRRRGRSLTLSLRSLLVVAGDVRFEGVTTAVERVTSVLVVQDASKADFPLVAVAAQIGVETQTAAVQVLRKVSGGWQTINAQGKEGATTSEHALCNSSTHHQGLGAWAGQAGEGLPQKGGDLQQ